jgi:hypothetical protein
VKRNGGGIGVTRQGWITYGALLVLAVVAFGVAALALMTTRGTGDAASTTTATSAAASATASATASASAIATPAPTTTPTASAQPPKIQLPAKPVLLIMGDSYTASDGADRQDQGWAYLVAGSLGFPTNIDAVGGTGFAWGGGAQDDRGQEYGARLRKIAATEPAFVPNLLILQGGQNDALSNNPAEIESATTETIESARRLWPGVQVVVLGPSAPQPLAERLRDANSAVRAGAAAANAPFIDAYGAGWFTAANSPAFDADGAHVNTAGHRYLADRFLAAWNTLVR